MTSPFSRRSLLATLLASTLLAASAAAPVFAETVLNKVNGGEPQTLDPGHTSIDVEEMIVKDLFEGLLVYDAAGKIIPGAAESWTISKDGATYTFKIRANAKWSNGDPVTAGDFVYSFGRVENPKEAATYANILYPIKNAQAINGGKAELSTLGAKALDDKTLELTLERPTPYILQLLAHQTALPVHKASIEKFGKDWIKPGNMVTNGAYMLTENVANDHITMVKNPNYWDGANVKIDKVVDYPIEDQAASQQRFLAGEMDMVFNFQADQREFLKGKIGDQVHVWPSVANYYYEFDERQPPFDDVRVRRALSMAIDRDFLANKIFSGANLPCYSWVPPGIEGYTPALPDFASMSQLDREDKAKALLKEAGYGEGGKPLKIEIRYNTNDNHKKAALAVADNWKALGAEVTLFNSDVKTHYSYLETGGAFNAARAAWVADYADPENFLAMKISTNKSFNYGHYSNPEYDELLKKSYEERDLVIRSKMLEDAEALLARDQPAATVMTNAALWLVSTKVKGFVDNSVNQHMTRFLSLQ